MRSPRLVVILSSVSLIIVATFMNLRNWTVESKPETLTPPVSSPLVGLEMSNPTNLATSTPTYFNAAGIKSPGDTDSGKVSSTIGSVPDEPSGERISKNPDPYQPGVNVVALGFEPPGTDLSPTPTSTSTPTSIPPPTNTPTPSPTPQSVNGISSDDFIVLNETTRLHIREIFSRGQRLGRNPKALSRIGASIIETDQFLVRFGTGDYELGPYYHLQPVINYFAESFSRYGVGIRRGLSSWGVLDPAWADRGLCQANETMIACEFRLNNPSAVILVLGTNDIGSGDKFEQNMRQIVEYSIEEGVIPILTTKADRFEGRDNRNNEILRKIASVYRVPLWDFDLVASTLPNKGMGRDNVHLTFLAEFDYRQPQTFQRGYGLFNLTCLMVLDEVWGEMQKA